MDISHNDYVIEDDDDAQRQAHHTITVKVKCLRAPPVANPDDRTTDENTPVTLNPLENDTDPENEPLDNCQNWSTKSWYS